MKSKIEIEFPFTDKYDSAYKVTSQGRNSVVLYSTITKERTTISNAKYMMSVHLKRHLLKDEHVDHINNDKLDDRIDNFQILSLAENNRKQAALKGCAMVEYKCPICEKIFSVKRKNSHYVGKRSQTSITCSKSCGGKASFSKPGIIELRQYNWYDEHPYNEQPTSTPYFPL